MVTRRKRDWRERFDAKWYADVKGCHLWSGALNSNGYGVFYLNGRMQYAHRIAYNDVGALSEETEIDHLCRVRRCVNPKHLEPVSHRENTLRGDTVSGKSARQELCIRGHVLPERAANGRRRCKPCAAILEAKRGIRKSLLHNCAVPEEMADKF